MKVAHTKFNKEDLGLFYYFLKCHNFVSHNFTEKVSYKISSSDQKEFILDKNQQFIFPPLNDHSEEAKQKIIEHLDELKKSSKFFENFTFNSKLAIGDIYNPIKLPFVYGDDEKFAILTKQDQVLMLFFWKSE